MRAAAGRRRDLALSSAAEFDRCLARPAAVKTGAFALHVAAPGPDVAAAVQSAASTSHDSAGVAGGVATGNPYDDRPSGDPEWRLGLVIPKRFEASAVARNTIKRRWRGAFRVGRTAWAHEFGSADVVVRMLAPLMTKAERAAQPDRPARVRARAAFDPGAAFVALAERLRRGRDPRVGPAPARRARPT